MNKFKSRFKPARLFGGFNKQERSGIFFLLLVIIVLQVVYFLLKSNVFTEPRQSFKIDGEAQAQIDALKENRLKRDSVKIYPFNPNFITDYKGYTLGMSPEEIDRLHAFRAQNHYVNSPDEFQKVTQVSDSLLNAIAPYFKFPEWTKKSKQSAVTGKRYPENENGPASLEGSIKDLNAATAQDLKTIYGIGEKLSTRIIKFRNRLGGFLVDEQLYDVYGLEPEVVQRTLVKFRVLNKPKIQKIDINEASADEISKLVYIKFDVAKRIVDRRNTVGSFGSFDELSGIEGFPSDKIDRIALYLQL